MIDNSMTFKLFFLCLTLAITLVFGLYPKDFSSEHTPLVNSTGELSFSKYSVATTHANLSTSSGESKNLTLDVNLQIPQMPDINNRFSVIFSINDAQGNSLMLLGQWKKQLVLMSGDDYSNKKKESRITIPLDGVEGYNYSQPLHIQIRATEAYTTVTINDQQIARRSDYLLQFAQKSLIVSLGNTLDRKQGWTGTVKQFELNFAYCPPEYSRDSTSSCSTAYDIDLQEVFSDSPIATYKQFTLPGKKQSNSRHSWILQPAYAVLSIEWLSSASLEFWQRTAFYKDVLINLLGFVPITLAIFLVAESRYALSTTALITITATFTISILIESVQIYLPSRTSSIVDLVVNTTAGIITTALVIIIRSMTKTASQRMNGTN